MATLRSGVLVLLALCLVLQCVLAATDAEKAKVWRSDGDAAVVAKHYEQAIRLFTKAVKADGSVLSYWKRASAHQLSGKESKALKDLNHVLTLQPEHKAALLRRAKLHLWFGSWDDAEADLKALLALDANHGVATQKLQDAATGRRLEQDAMPWVERIVAPKEGEPLVEEAHVTHVLSLLSEALAIGPHAERLLVARARVALVADDLGTTVNDCMTLLKANQRNTKALLYRGEAFFSMGEVEAAVKHWRECLRFDPDNKACKKAFKNSRTVSKTWARVEQAEAEHRWQDMLEDLVTMETLDSIPGTHASELLVKRCTAHVNAGNAAEAVDACGVAIDLGGEENVDLWINRARAHSMLEQWDRAIGDLTKASNLQPRNGHIRRELGEAQKRKKMAERKDYYKILGVERTAHLRVIRKAYREAARIWHPDKHDGDTRDEAELRFREYTEAYEILSDDEKRGAYDRGDDLEPQHHGGGFRGGGSPFGNVRFNFRHG